MSTGRPFKKGNKAARGGARPGAGRKSNEAKQLERELLEAVYTVKPKGRKAIALRPAEHAMRRLVELMYSDNHRAAASACKVAMDRDWGTARQSVHVDMSGAGTIGAVDRALAAEVARSAAKHSKEA